MQKSGVIVKICITAVFLLIAIVISFPTFGSVFGMIGGALDFSAAEDIDLKENKTVDGTITYIIDYSSADNSGSFSTSSYYYLVNLGGKKFNKEETKHYTTFIKAKGSSDAYNELNALLKSEGEFKFSGIVKKADKNVEKMFDDIIEAKGLSDKNVIMCDCYIDITTAPKAILSRFLISLIFYAGFIFTLILTINTFKRNREVDYMYHERAMTKAVADVRSGANQPDGSDEMFGDRGTEFVQGGKTAPLTPAASYPASRPRQDDQDYYQERQNRYEDDQGYYQGQSNQYQGQQNQYPEEQNFYQGQQFGGQNNYDDDGFFGG